MARKWRRLNVQLSELLDDRINRALPYKIKSDVVRELLTQLCNQLESDPTLIGDILLGQFKLTRVKRER